MADSVIILCFYNISDFNDKYNENKIWITFDKI